MNMRALHLLRSAAIVALLAATSLVASAQMPNEYQLVKPPQPGGSNGQIEVIEFFSYACPHCSEFDPLLSKWRAAQDKDVVFKRVPVSFDRADWGAVGKLYLTLNAMGLSDKLDPAVFKAIQTDRVRLDDERARNDWLTKQGIDVRQFDNTWRSFSVDAQAKRALELIAAYKVMAVPTLEINGKYVLEGGDPHVLETATKLIAKERALHPAPAAESSIPAKSAKATKKSSRK
jgi:protein dithiol oxidoreductase (disulfide-forming)